MSANADGSKKRSSAGTTIRPQAYSEKTVVESVMTLIQDVGQAYSNQHQIGCIDKEKISWARFESGDINDVVRNGDFRGRGANHPPLLLLLGYTNGVQIWMLSSGGDAQEILSLRQGHVRILRILPQPDSVFGVPDSFASDRPLVVVCDSTCPGKPYCSVSFVSLVSAEQVHNIKFSSPVLDILCNSRSVVVTFQGKIAVFDACTLKCRFSITSCYPGRPPGSCNPVALGNRWLAYADKKLVAMHQSGGGMAHEGAPSYTATVLNTAKSISKGLAVFTETVAQSLTGGKASTGTSNAGSGGGAGANGNNDSHTDTVNHSSGGAGGRVQASKTIDGGVSLAGVGGGGGGGSVARSTLTAGVVTVVDVEQVKQGQVGVSEENGSGDGVVAHFPAHAASEPISALKFDHSGALLFTASRAGHHFHVFRVQTHPCSSSQAAAHHLYVLRRGDTDAIVQDVSFTVDSRWVAVSTLRGTTHVFPITPHGGNITVRSHVSPRVVNRISRFQRSAGLEEFERRTVHARGHHSPPVSSDMTSAPPRPGSVLKTWKTTTKIHKNILRVATGSTIISHWSLKFVSLNTVSVFALSWLGKRATDHVAHEKPATCFVANLTRKIHDKNTTSRVFRKR